MNRDPFLELAASETNTLGSFKDPWKRPYRVVMWKDQPTDALNKYFQVYSCGPNTKWEHGKNDTTAAGKPDDIAPNH
jgi:hypothetical protein